MGVGSIVFRTSHTVKALSAPDEVWALVKDVTKWGSWLLGVEQVQLPAPPAPGLQGLLHLGDGMVHQMLIQNYTSGRIEIIVNLRYGVRMRLMVDVSSDPPGSKIRLEGELMGAMSLMHLFGWGKNLRTGLVPTTRRLGILSQEVRR